MQNDKIYLNARFLMQRLTGVQRFAIEITKELKKTYGEKLVVIAPKGILHKQIGNQLEVVTVGQFSGYFWEQVELPMYLKNNGRPLLVNLCNMAPVCYSNKIVTVHDLAFSDMSQNFNWKFRMTYQYLMPKLLRSTKKLITVSNFSKSRLKYHYPFLKEEDMAIVPNGVERPDNSRYISETESPFILSVASSSMRKNLGKLIEAFQIFNNTQGGKYKLHLVGDKNRVFEKQKALLLGPDIIALGRLSDEELHQNYEQAAACLNLSLYEGFGLPILEALSHSTPVVCSDIEVHREIFKNAVIFTDPQDAQAVAESLVAAVSNQGTDRRLAVEDLLEKYTWKNSARKLTEAIEQVQNQSSK